MLKLPRRLYPIPSSAAAGLFSSFFSLQISLLILWIKPDLAMPKWIKFRRSFFHLCQASASFKTDNDDNDILIIIEKRRRDDTFV